MTITIEQREKRRSHIGSSDCAAILGLDEFRSPHDVWLEKRFDTEDVSNDAIEAGNVLESAILDWCEEQIGQPITRNVYVERGVLAANLDGKVEIPRFPEIVEAKSTGQTGKWGEPLTDEVPDRVVIQVHHQMLVAGSDVAHVPVIFGNYGIRLRRYIVPFDKRLGDLIEEQCLEWWRRHMDGDTPPAEGPASDSVVRRIRRQPKKTVAVEDDLVIEWKQAKDAAATAAAIEKRAKARLMAALGDAEAGDCSIGRVTYFEQHRKGYTRTVEPCSYRVLRFTSAKGF